MRVAWFLLLLHTCDIQSTYVLLSHGNNPREVSTSTNDGNTWVTQKTTIDKLPVNGVSLGFYCLNESRCIFGYWGSIMMTTDGFKTQRRVFKVPNKNNDEATITGIQCVQNGTICMATVGVGDSGEVYRSIDGGLRWNKVYSLNYELKDLSCVQTTDGESYCMAVGGSSTVIESSNGGQRWSIVSYNFKSRRYFQPSCPVTSIARQCRMPTKLDSVSCRKPYDCAISFRGYQTGSSFSRRIQNGALCNIMKSTGTRTASIYCNKLSIYNRRVKLHCTSSKNCLAVTTRTSGRSRYNIGVYKYNSNNLEWSTVATKPTVLIGNNQLIFGTRSVYDIEESVSNSGRSSSGSSNGSSSQNIDMKKVMILSVIILLANSII